MVSLHPTQEQRYSDGSLLTPASQTIFRENHWLDQADSLGISMTNDHTATLSVRSSDSRHYLRLRNIPLDQLVPRLHYSPAVPPDEFDGFNLRMAEYTRNGLMVPVGTSGDRMAHFETNLDSDSPWQLENDFTFIPSPTYCPTRVGLVNNCLKAGLWELIATDHSGEVYHGWFKFPLQDIFAITASVNGIPDSFVKTSLASNQETAPLTLDRLRKIKDHSGMVHVSVRDAPIGYSSQESRRRLQRAFVQVKSEDGYRTPERLSDFRKYAARMFRFVNPGIYSRSEYEVFDLAFLFSPVSAEYRIVEPRTFYSYDRGRQNPDPAEATTFIEIELSLQDFRIVLGNLPVQLLVNQEDFVIHGFGVGILEHSAPGERRDLLLESGPPPSFAYLVREDQDGLVAINSHSVGVEQIYIRAYPNEPKPYLNVVVTSYERIVDLVRYIIPIPEHLIPQMQQATATYSTPAFLNYQDDNVR